jgi:hypothetical protein
LETPVDVADYFIRVDLAPCNTMKVNNCSRWDLEPFQFLLSNCVGYGTHVPLDILLRKRRDHKGSSLRIREHP